MTPAWITGFLDFAPDGFDGGVRFWSEATGYDVSPRRGDTGEFATLVPDEGDAFLRVQRLEEGADRMHVDLHVEAPREPQTEQSRSGRPRSRTTATWS